MPGLVLIEDFEVVPELEAMLLPREVMLDIFDMAAGEWARVNSDDPVETGLYEMRRWMTRYLRTDVRLAELGWTSCKAGQIEGIRHDGLRKKLIFANTDQRTGVPSKRPSNVSQKGPRTKSLTESNLRADAPDMYGYSGVEADDPILSYDFWCFCGHISDEKMSAEISRPIEVTDGYLRDYSKRIMLIEPQEYRGSGRTAPVPEEFADIETPTITAKA